MSKILVVFGATGQQGGSVIHSVINDSELSKQYTIRAVSRDLSKPAAKALQDQGIEVVKGDAEQSASLHQVMKDAHTVFALTVTIYDDKTKAREIAHGKAMADAAVAAGVQYFIFSTLPHVGRISGGKYTHVEGFDSKAEVEDYIRTLPIKSAFFAPGSFMQNFSHSMAPRPTGDGTFAITNVVTPQTKLPLIDTSADTGKYIGAIMAGPEKYEGKTLSAATKLVSFEDIVATMSRVTGKTVTYNQLPAAVFEGFMPAPMGQQITEMMLYIQDFGYYGPKTDELVEETAKGARGKLTSLEEYLEKNPLSL